MKHLFDVLFAKGSRPVRRDVNLRMTVDSDGRTVMEPVDIQTFNLSPEGSIDRVRLTPERFYHCGCNAELPMGGRCAEAGCRQVSCIRCHGRRAQCQKPICPEHSRFLGEDRDQRIRLCPECYDALKRKRTIRTLVKGVLSPFIVFEKGRKR